MEQIYFNYNLIIIEDQDKEREICSHSSYRNIVTFSFPIQSQSSIWRGSFHESGYKHNLMLEKYLARNTNPTINTSRYQLRLGKHILIIAQQVFIYYS